MSVDCVHRNFFAFTVHCKLRMVTRVINVHYAGIAFSKMKNQEVLKSEAISKGTPVQQKKAFKFCWLLLNPP